MHLIMPDKRATHAAERVLLPRKVRECALLGRERDSLNFAARILADAPAIEERALESDPNDSHNDTHYEPLRVFAVQSRG